MSRSTFITIESPKHPPIGKAIYPITVKVMDDDGIGTFGGELDEYWANMFHEDLQRIVRKIRKMVNHNAARR